MKYFKKIQDLPPRPRPTEEEIEELRKAMKRVVARHSAKGGDAT